MRLPGQSISPKCLHRYIALEPRDTAAIRDVAAQPSPLAKPPLGPKIVMQDA